MKSIFVLLSSIGHPPPPSLPCASPSPSAYFRPEATLLANFTNLYAKLSQFCAKMNFSEASANDVQKSLQICCAKSAKILNENCLVS